MYFGVFLAVGFTEGFLQRADYIGLQDRRVSAAVYSIRDFVVVSSRDLKWLATFAIVSHNYKAIPIVTVAERVEIRYS